MTMAERPSLMYTSKLPVLTSRYAARPRRLPRIMENVDRPSNASKSVVFYKNGDKYFQGHQVVVTQRKYRSFDSLLTELTRVTKLPHGVRFLLTPTTGRRVDTLEGLEDGKSYIASSFTKLRKIHYGTSIIKADDEQRKELHTRKVDNIRLKPLHYKPDAHNRENKKHAIIQSNKSNANVIKPRLITVIRNGFRPRRIVKVLLNRRTAQTFEQVLDDVTSAVGVIGGSGVRKLFTVEGKQVQGLSDLLNSENFTFIAVGDEKFHAHDLQDILKESNINQNGHKPKHHKKSRQEKDLAVRIPPSLSTANEIDDNDLHSNDSSRLTATDEASIGSHRNSVKNKHIKLPHIKELDQNKAVNGLHLELSNKQKEVVLPPIDANNNQHIVEYEEKADQIDKPRENSIRERKDETSPRKETEQSPRKEAVDAVGSHETFEKKEIKNIRDLFDIGRKLGDGNFAVVRECVHKVTNEKYALKIIDRSKLKGKEKMLENEIQIMKRCNHPNIVSLVDDFHGNTEIYLVMELVPGGDLFDAISTAVKFTEPVAANYVHDICSSLQYLHKRKIVHRDLKPENLMVSPLMLIHIFA